jgi:hypothetical protein
MPLRDQIVEQAMPLSPEDRIFVADALEQSLAGEGFATPEIASAWAAEVERRIAAKFWPPMSTQPSTECDSIWNTINDARRLYLLGFFMRCGVGWGYGTAES